jgi:hypothetical protein
MYHGVGEVEQQWITEYFRDESMGNWAGLGAPATPPDQCKSTYSTCLQDANKYISDPPTFEMQNRICTEAYNLCDPSTRVTSTMDTLRTVYEVAGVAGAAAGAYHGYKRNNGSVGWAIGWFVFGSFLPWLALPIMFAEGFGKRKQ